MSLPEEVGHVGAGAQRGKSMSKVSRGIVSIGSLVALTFGSGLSPAGAAQVPDPTLDHTQLCSPNDPSNYSTTSNNIYFPMRPGQLAVFLDETEDEPVGLRIKVLNRTESLYKNNSRIVTRVVEEIEWVDEDRDGVRDRDEELLEISRNFFAQTGTGTVCYFGETVDIYEDGELASHEGAWRADQGNNAPGIIMPDPARVGDVYLQEFAPGVALDQAEHLSIGVVGVGDDTYEDALSVSECPLAEDDKCKDPSHKVYAPGKGLVQDGGLILTKFVDGK